MYAVDDLMRCDPPAGCQGCGWQRVAEEVCRGVCSGEQSICPWLLVCRCANPERSDSRGRSLQRLVLEQPASVQVAPVDIPKRWVRLREYEIRQRRSEETIRQIAASIASNGLYSPLGGVGGSRRRKGCSRRRTAPRETADPHRRATRRRSTAARPPARRCRPTLCSHLLQSFSELARPHLLSARKGPGEKCPTSPPSHPK